MSDDFKSTVSRTLSTEDRQYTNVVWQAGKPPLDSELNLVGQIATDNLATTVSTNAHSGVLFDPRSSTRDFSFDPLWSNYMKVKGFKAIVNGLIVNVEETNVNLPPPPASDSRIDFVFLEVWKGILSADNSGGDLSNKSSNTEVYSNGRIDGAGLPDEMVDSNVGFETTKRIQVQYRFRVVSGVDLKVNLEGMESPLVLAQGPLANPTNNVSFNNQWQNGDTGLWVAHMTSDGCPLGQPCNPQVPNTALSNLLSENIVYALPICAVSRRNSKAYVAFDGSNNANQNGAPTRTPSSNSATNAVGLTQATLFSNLTSTYIGAVPLRDGDGSGLSDNNLYGGDTYLVIGSGINQEVVKVSVYTTPNSVTITERGKGGTQAKYHPANSEIKLFNGRPDGKYSDEIHPNDLFDMRHATTLGEWDYQSLLESSLSDLIFNNLQTSYKQNQQNSTCAGPIVEEVSILNDVANPAQVFEMDLPNGFRDTWSDGVIPQTGITLYLEPTAIGADGVSTVNLNVPDAGDWEIAPDLEPTAFLFDTATPTLKAGSWIKINLDLTESNLGYGVNHSKSPATISEAGIRMIAPREVKDPTTKRPPITIEELGEYHKPLLYPRLENNYEKPFIVLGKEKYTSNFLTDVGSNATDKNYYQLYAPTAYNNSDVYGSANGTTAEDGDLVIAVRLGNSGINTPTEINNLEYLVTDNGYDTSGDSSSLYAVIYGDPARQSNNGVFKVIDILNSDTVASNVKYYTDKADTTQLWAPTSFVGFIILKPIDNIDRSAGLFSDTNLNIEFRTQELTDQDDNVMIAITESTIPDLNPANPNQTPPTQGQLHTTGEFQLSVSVLYPPSTGGIANVANNIHKIGLTPPASGEFLNVSKSVIHGAGFATLPLVENEIDLPTQNHISLWNRLPSSNLPIGVASSTSMGGRVINEEADREAEAFTDEKSKTIVLRPFQKKGLIINKATSQALGFNGVSVPLVPNTWSDGRSVDSPNPEFLNTKDAAYVLPEAMMPRFGRQDIPLHTRTGSSDQFYNGLNHLFIDDPSSTTDNVFTIIGGRSNTGSPGVNHALFVTGVNYGERTTHIETNSRIATGARKKTLTVPTSDFGSTTKGIELPPYFGVARIYGVYERGLFKTELAQDDNLGGHQNNRINTKDLSDCPNLLRTDTSSFTMYINQNGGNDHVSGYSNAHTYVLTEHAIDITRLEGTTAGWTDASTFDDFDYVIECVVFMFADGFISHNRYVIPREYNGGGIQQDNSSSSKLIIDAVIPFAPPISSAITVAYSRTPYQGDPFNTLLQGTDQVVPQGRKSLNELKLGTKTQPVSLNGTNRRDVEVLASMDFYTTLGTGKIGGQVYPTTITDVGYTPFPPNRDPSSLSGTHISLHSSTFTEESTQMGGFATLFLFVEGTDTTTNATVNLYKNGVSIYAKSLSGINFLATQAPLLQTEIQALGFNCFQVRGDFQQQGNQNQIYYGIIVQAPNPTDSFELEVDWKNLKNGQNIQVFEGMREVPMSFQLFNSTTTANTEHLNNNRSKSKVPFSSVIANAINAGNGNNPISLTGMTSRLPIGSLVRDSDFICEDILNNSSSYLFSSTGSFSTISNPVPVSPNGVPYTQTLGISGDLLQLTDGKITNLTEPALQPKYTIARGGGAVFGVGGDVPGGPLSFLATSFGESDQPVLKGSALACRAMLVRNFYEQDESLNPKSYGDELQLVIVSHAVDGNGGAITLGGDISPSGYGEGFSATDRFRIKGKPLAKIYGRKSDTEVAPAPYNS